MKIMSCLTHNTHSTNPWVICIHVAQGVPPKVAERMVVNEDNWASGQVLCAACAADTPTAITKRYLKTACEKCVLDRWPLDNAS